MPQDHSTGTVAQRDIGAIHEVDKTFGRSCKSIAFNEMPMKSLAHEVSVEQLG
ncbi:hypothetical protein AB4Z52_22630 [Rhizobium sp. 2YAF20]|uniref:hypothetical protein n=1 Tax=Rhizobium sp. 2YAF20 TaxID=3233027 RepID=UPI003F99CD7E